MIENTKKFQQEITFLLNSAQKLTQNDSIPSSQSHNKLQSIINPIAEKLPLFELELAQQAAAMSTGPS